jgi:hypothetical protein
MTYLLAQTALITAIGGKRIYYVRAKDATAPYIAFQKIGAPRLHSNAGSDGIASARFQFSIFASTYITIKSIAEALQAALQGYSGTMGAAGEEAGVRVMLITYDDETDLDPGDGTGLYGVACDYIVRHKE